MVDRSRIAVLMVVAIFAIECKSQFALEVFGGGDVNTLKVTTDSASILTRTISEKGDVRIGYNFGIIVSYDLNRVRIRTKLGYRRFQYSHKVVGLNFGTGPRGTSGEAVLENTFGIDALQVGLGTQYRLNRQAGNWNYNIGAEIVYNGDFDDELKSELVFTSGGTQELSGLHNGTHFSNWTYGLISGVEKKLSNRVTMSLEFAAQFTNNHFQMHVYKSKGRSTIGIGLRCGIIWKPGDNTPHTSVNAVDL